MIPLRSRGIEGHIGDISEKSGIKMRSVGLMPTNWFYRYGKIITIALLCIIDDATNS